MSLGETLGRREAAMNWSQENCPIDSHRWTCERWGGDFVHSLDIAGQDLAINRTECFQQSPFPCREKGFVALFQVSEGFSLWLHTMGRKLLIHFIQFYSAAGLVAAPE